MFLLYYPKGIDYPPLGKRKFLLAFDTPSTYSEVVHSASPDVQINHFAGVTS